MATMNKAAAYRNEFEKQKDPYAYFLKQEKGKERGRSIAVDGPLPCHILPEIPGLSASSYQLTKNKISYVILKTEAVCLYADGAWRLIEKGCIPDAAEEALREPMVIYCDHDHMRDDGKRHTPCLKPDHSIHSLLSRNYMGDLVAIREELLVQIVKDQGADAFGPGLSAEEAIHAVLLEAILRTDKIVHVTETLYHFRDNANEDEIHEAYANRKLSPVMEDRVRHTMDQLGICPHDKYSLSVIIPSKDHADILAKCLDSLREKTHFAKTHDLEVLVIDNGSYESQKAEVEDYIRCNTSFPIRYFYRPEPFNFSRMCDLGAREAKGELLLFLNDDVEFIQEDCLERMCMYAMAPLTGAVGAKLLFPDAENIQHVGVTNLSCGPTHKLSHYPDAKTYYFGVNRHNRNMLALTGACLMVKREKYFQVQGFHDKMSVSYNDVDLCVNLYENGYKNILLNECVFLHHESFARGNDLTDTEKLKRLKSERDCFYERHPWLKDRPDPFYHPDLIQDTLDYRINVVADHEMRTVMSTVEVFECHSIRQSSRLQLNIEQTGMEPDLLLNAQDAYVIRGWSLYLKHDERRYDRYLLLIPDEGNSLRISLMPVLREDVQTVFEKQKYAGLAGFCAKIPAGMLKPDGKYRVALLYEHKALHYKIMTFGAYYEPGKGYGLGEVL